MARAQANGSFYVSRGGFQYTGIPGTDDNQILTYNAEDNAVTATNLGDLVGSNSVSQYEELAPKNRPDGDSLEIGDLWTDKNTKLLSIWDGEEWVLVKTINGNPVGAIIQSANTNLLSAPPVGYLWCDGTECPEEYEELRDLLFETNGNYLLPSLGAGFLIKY